jgi:hypothetical protein
MAEIKNIQMRQNISSTVKFASSIIAITILFNVLTVLKSAGPANFLKYAISFILSILVFLLTSRKQKDFRAVTIICLIATFIWGIQAFISTVWSKPTSYSLTSMTIVYFNIFLTYVIYKVKVDVRPVKFAYYVIAGYFLYQLLVAGVTSDNLFFESSGALLGAMIVSLAVLISYLDYRDYKRMQVLPWIIAVILSALSLSRTALICAAIAFIGFLYFKIKLINKKFVRYFFLVVVLASLVSFIYIFWDYFMYMEIASRFQDESLDLNGRDAIWSAYFEDFDLNTILIGRSIDENNTLAGFDNPHNSYIRFHSFWGIFSIIGIIFVLYCIIRLLARKNYFYAFLSVILLALGFSNIVFFFGFYDFILYALILEGFNKSI